MYNKSHITLWFATFLIFYLIYKIISFQIENFQTEKFSAALTAQNEEIRLRTLSKENLEKYISTNAYKTQVAKATQNKNLPWETIINVVSQEDIDGNANVDSQEIFYTINKAQEDPTLKMSNPERWQYLLRNGINQ